MPCYPSSKSHGFLMRVTGRKARDPQAEEINCKWQTSFFFPSLYKIKRFLLNSVLSGGPLVQPELNFSQTLN